ncbi:MAG TPA: TonB-dependent receptor, partial [Allosphingosinicella sp.]|nr:TonB-dependent receptor [Allosphingosinicella sp.]
MFAPIILSAAQIAPSPAPPATPPHEEEIVVTAALTPLPEAEAPASVTLLTGGEIEALGLPVVIDLLRLSPGVAVAQSGGPGSQAQVRIRGAEANHSLVFIDGIAFNDLAANNQARFETFGADNLGRLELIRGPQSALWGSEAIGGVIAMTTPDPLGAVRGTAALEVGELESYRATAALASGGESAGVSGTLSWSGSEGIDILGRGAGDRDGFENVTASLKGVARTGSFEFGAVGRYIHHDVAFDGFDANFQRADSDEASEAETYAARGWAGYGLDVDAPWWFRLEAQHLDSQNGNRNGAVRTNDSYGRRTRYGAQAGHRLVIGGSRHELIAAVEREEEEFGTRDLQFGGASDRDLERGRTALVGEWRANWGDWLTTDVALRHDDFSRFEDATTFRVQAEARLGGGFSLLGSYGEGIAQPSFVDLFGFDPGSRFIGNPDLGPERSEGYEAGLRFQQPGLKLEAAAFSNDLEDEIVEDFSIFPDYTVVNAAGTSRRRGIELSADWEPLAGLSVGANYTYLDAQQPNSGGTAQERELRRPEHTANVFATWRRGPLTLGAALSYVGERIDRDFDLFPAPLVELDAYLLASGRVAYRLTDELEAFARVENAFDDDYQDVVGYATP